MLSKRNWIIILLITIVLPLALYIVQLVHHHAHMKNQESEIYETVKSYLKSAHDVLLNSPGEPLVPTYRSLKGWIWHDHRI